MAGADGESERIGFSEESSGSGSFGEEFEASMVVAMAVGLRFEPSGGLDFGWSGVLSGDRNGLFSALVAVSMRRRLAAGVDIL